MSRGGGNGFLMAASFISLVTACVSATSVHAGTARAGGEALETREAAAAFPDEIRGTVVFNGCVVDPAKIQIRAVPLG